MATVIHEDWGNDEVRMDQDRLIMKNYGDTHGKLLSYHDRARQNLSTDNATAR